LDLEGGWDDESPFYSKEYALLAKELRDTLGDDFYLTSAVGATNNKLWTDDFLSVLDWVNIMIYDLHNWWSDDIKNDSGFDDQLEAANAWSKRLPKEKLVFGAPFYGHGWNHGANERLYYEINWWRPANSAPSTWTWYKSDYFLYFVLDSLFDLSPQQDSIVISKSDKLWLNSENSNMGFRGSYTDGIIYFNGRDLLKKKAKWTIENNYGGMMVWELSNDVPTSHQHSLLNALAEQFYESAKNIPSPISAKHIKTTINGSWFSLRNNTLKISLPSANSSEITITDVRGRIVFTRTVNAKEVLVSLDEKRFANGVYLLNVETKDNNGKVYYRYSAKLR
jgi:GH18 family chitinase